MSDKVPSTIVVRNKPEKPVLIFDGDCRFCRFWILRWQWLTGDRIEYIEAQSARVESDFPEISVDEFDASVQLVETSGRVVGGAQAVYRTFDLGGRLRWLLWLYLKLSLFSAISEWGYRQVAKNRMLLSRMTWFFQGMIMERPSYRVVRWLFLRGLGLVYLAAFTSLWVQVDGLYGAQGIAPIQQYMERGGEFFDAQGVQWDRYRQIPSLCWMKSSDAFLHILCGGGVLLSLLLIAGVLQAPALLGLWLGYLSLVSVGQEFLSFQWDILLLEIGFLAIFFAPWQLRPSSRREGEPSRLMLWLFRLLLFKLMLLSGVVKLLSKDELWWNLTALTVHYETQPLPTWIGWYAHQLPLWIQKVSCFLMFGIELVVPFLIFGPRRMRLLAFWPLIALQFVIILTGNYCFFNLLTILLCMLLLDDRAARRIIRLSFLKTWFEGGPQQNTQQFSHWHRFITIPVAIVVIPVSVYQTCRFLPLPQGLVGPIESVQRYLGPLRSLNGYGLFANMTESRPEIIVQGSHDGETWLDYEFRYKPGDLGRAPGFNIPHQPRLDWQMWFAALGDIRRNEWLARFGVRLLQDSPPVVALLEVNPFADSPPKYVRAVTYDYRFTRMDQRREEGHWWRREFLRIYLPSFSLEMVNPGAF